MKKIIFDHSVIEDLTKWTHSDARLVKKVFELINDIKKHPFEGLGKPEMLKRDFKGCWSRRITHEHRLIYKVLPDNDIFILSVHGHYEGL